MDSLLYTLTQALGAPHVRTGADAAPYVTDWRKRYHGQALAVVFPANTDEVAAVVRACATAHVPVVPQGGNTGLVGSATPDASGRSVVMSTLRLNRIRQVDVANQTMTVEAGCILQNVQQAAADAGCLFPLRMGSEGSCTIGGNLASNAGGTQVLRYGNARELCLGLEAVTPQGDIWHGLHGLRKNNTGYDLRHLLIGSEGTLGIITAATLKLFPLPGAQMVAWAALPSLDAAVALLALARQRLDAGLTGFELMNHTALQMAQRHFPQQRVPFVDTAPWCVLLENSVTSTAASGAERAQQQLQDVLEAAMEQELVTDAVLAESLAQARSLWHVRESIPLAQAQEGLNIKLDIAIPTSAIPAFVAETDAVIRAQIPGVHFVTFGHMGDSNLHYNVQAPTGTDPAAFLRQHEAAVNALVFDAVRRFGGSISAEHGIGQLKRDILTHYQSPVALGMMRTIKQALDPKNTMNPGKMLSL